MVQRLLVKDLYDYLISLSAALEAVGERGASVRVKHVSKFASGSPSELFGESRLAPPDVLAASAMKLPDMERARLREKIREIDQEFRLIGGG
jgi:hypothetical protein